MDCSGASTRFLASRKVAPPPPHPSGALRCARTLQRGASREMPVSAVTTPGAVARRGGHVGSSYRVAASRPPPGWTRARSTRVSRMPSAVVEARAPRSRRVPRGERVGRRENTKTVKKRSLEPSFACPVVLASCSCTRSGGHSYSPCVRDAARRGRRSVPRVGEQRRCCPRTQKPAYFCPSQTKTRSSASRALRRCCRATTF